MKKFPVKTFLLIKKYQLTKKNKNTKKEIDVTFEDGLEIIINKYNIDTVSNIPDFVLAKYLISCIENLTSSVKEYNEWHGIKIEQKEKFADLKQNDNHLNNFYNDDEVEIRKK